jgi:hypothetical protein
MEIGMEMGTSPSFSSSDKADKTRLRLTEMSRTSG